MGFFDIYTDIPQDFLGFLMFGIIWLLTLSFLAICIYAVYSAFDYCYSTKGEGMGKIVDKGYHPSSSSTTFITSGTPATLIPITTHRSEDWTIDIEVDGKIDDFSVDKKIFDKIHIGQNIKTSYSIGGFSKKLYIDSVTL